MNLFGKNFFESEESSDTREQLENEYSRKNVDKAAAETDYAMEAWTKSHLVATDKIEQTKETKENASHLYDNESIAKTDRVRMEAFYAAYDILEKHMNEERKRYNEFLKKGHSEALELNNEYDELLKKEMQAMKDLQETTRATEDFRKNKLQLSKSVLRDFLNR